MFALYVVGGELDVDVESGDGAIVADGGMGVDHFTLVSTFRAGCRFAVCL